MQFNEQSKAAYVKILRAKLKAQMGEQAYRIDEFSDEKIIEMDRKWRERLSKEFNAKSEDLRRKHADGYEVF
jgi:hypothetical protein